MIVSTTLAGPGAEDVISDALRSASPLVDRCLVIISGCDGEATLRKAREAAGDKVAVSHLVWPGDYGKARNFALAEAERLGASWAMTLDIDERVSIDPKELVALDIPGCDAVTVHDRDLLYQKPRFIRCGAGARWKYSMHERLVVKGQQLRIPGHFWELPKSPEAERRRFERGLVECRKILDTEDCPHIRRHYAECLMSAGRSDEARAQFMYVAADPAAPDFERTWCRYRIAEFAVMDGHYEHARDLAGQALARDPGFIQELGWVMAHCSAKLGEFPAAALWASYALQAPIDYSRGGHRSTTWREGCTRLLESIEAAARRGHQGPPMSTEDHFRAREEFRGDYATLASSLVETLSFRGSHLDLGAGNGLLVGAMSALGVVSHGMELLEEARAATPEELQPMIRFGVGFDQWPSAGRHELVTCLEVLEHIPPEQGEAAVAAIAASSSSWVVFSAAQPGQGGMGHVNEQSPIYWRQLFEAHGFRCDEELTDRMRADMSGARRCWWLTRNIMVYVRGAGDAGS